MIKNIITKQKKFFHSNKTLESKSRKKALLDLKKSIFKYEKQILEALHLDLGKHDVEGYMGEISQVIEEINKAIKFLSFYTKPEKVKTPITHFMGKSHIIYEPYGVVLIISPWNYPFSLSLSPLVGAIAAGNCAIIKPSEFAIHTEKIIQKIISECFKEDFITVITGDAQIAEKLLEANPDYVFFTGSTRVGKIIASLCAKNLIPNTLELGGKSPCIVDESANLALSAKRIVWGKYFNAGQTCIAPDYIIVHHHQKDKLIKLIQKEIYNSFGKTPLTSNSFCRIITKNHFHRALKLLDFPSSLGKIYGGEFDEIKQKIAPTLIDFGALKNNPAKDLPIMKEEIFAPILPIFTYENLQECIQFIQNFEKPLALYLFTQNKDTQKIIFNHISFGGGCVNDCVIHIANIHLPFGGVGHSGMGTYHGKYTIETFTHKKAIYLSPSIDFSLRYPPYDKTLFGFHKLKILKFLFK